MTGASGDETAAAGSCGVADFDSDWKALGVIVIGRESSGAASVSAASRDALPLLMRRPDRQLKDLRSQNLHRLA